MIAQAVTAWERFWFESEETSTLALFRIVVGLVVLAFGLTLSRDLFDFVSADGIVAHGPDYDAIGDPGIWSVFDVFPGKGAIVIVFVALLVGAVALIAGLYTRLAAVIVFVAFVSLERRGIYAYNGGDTLIKVLLAYLVLAPAGESFSLDRLRRHPGRFWQFPRRAAWVTRLLQVQFSVIYISAVWAKAQGATWNGGVAVSYAMRLDDLHRFPIPFADTALMANLATYGTLATELALGILVWNRRLRPWVLLCGVALHLGIDYSMRVGFFSFAMLALYVVWVPPERASMILRGLQKTMQPRRPGVA